MVDVATLTEEHNAVREAMAEVSQTIDRGNVASHAMALHTLLNEIAEKVQEHLRVEDQDLYPLLVQDSDVKVKKIATQFRDNMGGLAEELSGYIRRYGCDGDIVKESPFSATKRAASSSVCAIACVARKKTSIPCFLPACDAASLQPRHVRIRNALPLRRAYP